MFNWFMFPFPPLEQQVYARVFPNDVKNFMLLHKGTKQESETVLFKCFQEQKHSKIRKTFEISTKNH